MTGRDGQPPATGGGQPPATYLIRGQEWEELARSGDQVRLRGPGGRVVVVPINRLPVDGGRPPAGTGSPQPAEEAADREMKLAVDLLRAVGFELVSVDPGAFRSIPARPRHRWLGEHQISACRASTVPCNHERCGRGKARRYAAE